MGTDTTSATEAEQVERANASGRTPVVFIHGLWLLPSSWDRWATVFEEAGYARAHARLARRSRDGRRGQGASRGLRAQDRRPGRRPLRRGDRAADEEAGRDRALVRRAAHADRRRAAVSRRRRSRSTRRRSAACCRCRSRRCARPRPCSRNPANRNRAVPLTYEQFRYGFANAVSEDEAKRALRDVRRAGARARRSSRRRPPTSTRGPRRRSTARTPSAARC